MIQEEFKSTEDEFVVNQAGQLGTWLPRCLVASNSPSVDEGMMPSLFSGGYFNPPPCWVVGCCWVSHGSWVNQRGASRESDGAACEAGKIDAKKRLERDIDPGTSGGGYPWLTHPCSPASRSRA